ncbi:PREDICTED: putative F-box/LRR-repeat protein 9 [Camelina sativa]|uniref:F-box/LRR-repeat protein 9 n=1 Tax=Camelina sativa TaxID=90675 RepID=A0ABM0XF82_CAMSA|nr:PREDICTED: putative F-box/LRR-repeat protein 9 [Camelina sativa]
MPMKNGKYINWAELPPELMSSILLRLSVEEILGIAQKVCRSWRRVSRDPWMWRKIDLLLPRTRFYDLQAMYRQAIDLSSGGLLEINFVDIGSDSLLTYTANRSSNLRRLRVVDFLGITTRGILEAVVKLPLLEEVEFSFRLIEEELLKGVGQSCPNLRTLKVYGNSYVKSGDDVALAIAKTMPGLCHLQLFGNGFSKTGLKAIFDNCPNLEHLELRGGSVYFNVILVADLEKRYSEKIKVVRSLYRRGEYLSRKSDNNTISDAVLEAEPEAVLGTRTNPRSGQAEVLIKWKGLPDYECSWEWVNTIKGQFPLFNLEDKVNFKGRGNDKYEEQHPPILYQYERKKRSPTSG